ncbi:MAG: CDP-alcohol phosphatidyltransferase family protein [Methanomassiliicoccales archaeon]|nr:CDP-alcohol phosphatidyltransferase family protein [Methanomassiliicoccales archaeon]
MRDDAGSILDPAAKALRNVSPNMLSLIALIIAVLSGFALYFSFWSWETLLPIASVLVIVSGFFDAVDGRVARLSGKISRRGDFLDHVLDRYADVVMIGAVAVSMWCNPYIGILALLGVLLTSYMGTQAQAVGAGRLYRGLLGRADRVVLMCVIPLIQWAVMFFGDGRIDFGPISLSVFELMMLWFGIVGNLTAIQRAVEVWKKIK